MLESEMRWLDLRVAVVMRLEPGSARRAFLLGPRAGRIVEVRERAAPPNRGDRLPVDPDP